MLVHRATLPLALLAACSGGGPTPLVDSSPLVGCSVGIETPLREGASRVQVAGTFSDWAPLDLTDPDGDGVYTVDLGELAPGTWAWKFLWDGAWEAAPPVDVRTTWQDGTENRALVVPDCGRPDLTAIRAEATADGLVEAELQWRRAADGAPLESLTIEVGGTPLPEDAVEVGEDGRIRIRVGGLTAGKQSLRARAIDAAGREAEPVFVPLWVEPDAFRWGDGVLYFAMIDRFRDGGPSPEAPITGHAPGAGYRGGDLVGLREAIDEGVLDELGVRSIWLSPVSDNPDGAWPGRDGITRYTGYHGYWTTSPRAVEGRLGTVDVPADQALHDVIEAAHARGIRVLLDVVLNHVHERHPWVTEHPEWFDLAAPCVCGEAGCGWEDKPRTCRFAPYLPDVEYRQQGAVDAAIAELRWWLDTYDVDGFRVDAAKHMDHVVMRTLALDLRARIDRPGGAHVYLIGETFAGSQEHDLVRAYIGDHELDGQFDFPLFWSIRDAVADDGSLEDLAEAVRRGDEAWGDRVHWMSPFFGNHDVPRLATELAGCDDPGALWGGCGDPLAQAGPVDAEQQRLVDRLSLAWAFVATQPGPPLLYYGDELGLAGGEDPDNRHDRPWGTPTPAQQALLDRVGAIGRLRAEHRALRRGERETLLAEPDRFVYARITDDGEGAIVGLARDAEGGRTVAVPASVFPDGTVLTDAVSGGTVTVRGGAVDLRIPAWGYGIWLP